MAYKVRLPRPISAQIGTCGLSRPALLRLLNRIYERLGQEESADNFAHNRAPENPDCFLFRVVLADGDTWHICRFLVHDRRDSGMLVIVGFSHDSRPASDG